MQTECLQTGVYKLKCCPEHLFLRLGACQWTAGWAGPGQLSCGPVHVRLYGFDLDTPSLARVGPGIEVRAWLREWSGVSVYRDGFRVWPYGEPNNDWLGLDQRRVNNPVVRLSNNQVIGFVAIGRDQNPLLLDQTSREGLFHNAAFEDLRRLIHFLLLHLENFRQTLRHPVERQTAEPVKPPTPVAPLEELARRLSATEAAELRKAAAAIEAHLAKEREQQQKTLASYAELAASGQALLGVESELRAVVADFRDAATLFGQQLREEEGSVPREISRTVRRVNTLVQTLEQRLGDLQSLAGTGGRRRAVDLHAEVGQALRLFEERVGAHGVSMKVVGPRGKKLARAEVRPENVRRILLLLLDNSLHSLAGRKDGRVEVSVWAEDEVAGFDFHDNGPGIPADRAEEVFLPHYTTRPGASGMGLTIVRAICRSHGGDCTLLVQKKARGPTIRVQFRRKQPRATVVPE